MPGIFQLKELKAKRLALVAENEVYRESLRFQARNLKLCIAGVRKHAVPGTASPLGRFLPMLRTFLASPLSRLVLSKRRARWLRLATSAWMAWQVYRRLSPLLQRLFSHPTSYEESAPQTPEEKTPAANI